MASIKTSIMLQDGMSPVFRSMNNVMNIVLNSFEAIQNASGNAVDINSIQAARSELAKVDINLNNIEQDIKQSDKAQQQFNNDIRSGHGAADGLAQKIQGFVGAFAGMALVKKGFDWLKDSMSAFDIQTNVERQLQSVLKNVGAVDGAFDSLKETASQIQSKGIYGDEAMLGGSAELATYINDPKAIQSMMGTLSNYAMGMSGGGAVDSKAMVDYATQLGKALDGTYDGLKKKGFELTESQKAIIESGTDMQKALVIDDVINQSWTGLYEQMSNTPQGKIIQLQNTWGDISETVGGKVYPAVLMIMDVFIKNVPLITNMALALADGFAFIIMLLSWVVEVVMEVGNIFANNWSIIEPILWGVIGALIVYNAVLGIGWLTTLKDIAAKIWKTTVDWLQTAATIAMTVAQQGLNAALAMCPITWIIIAIIALIAIFYAGVAAINKFAGTSLSATGIIAGAFAVLGAHIYNHFIVPTWNQIAAFVNFFANVFNDPVAAIKVLFYDLAQIVIGYVLNMARAIESLINKIPGVHIDITSGLDSFYNKLEAVSKEVKDKSGWVEVVGKLDFMDYGKAYNAGYKFGEGIENNIGNLLKLPELGSGIEMNGLQQSLDQTADNTGKMKDAMEMSSEDLKFIRDIAEREAINRFTTAEISVDFNGMINQISSNMDIDGFMNLFKDKLEEALLSSAEGVHI